MFTGFTEETIQFFLDLKFHNNTTFFHEQHERYVECVQHVFYSMIDDLAPAMRKIDPLMEVRPHKCLSRIHRDTRFSRDKSPYRKNRCSIILNWDRTDWDGEWDSGMKTAKPWICSGNE